VQASRGKNLSLKRYGARRLLRQFPDKVWKLGSINSLLERSHKTGTIVRQPGSLSTLFSLTLQIKRLFEYVFYVSAILVHNAFETTTTLAMTPQ